MIENEVIIIGGNHHNTLGVIRSLGLKKIYSYVIIISNESKPYISFSKYIKEYLIVESEEEVVPVLLADFSNLGLKPIIIACSDAVSSVLDLNHRKLSEMFHLPGSDTEGEISCLMNKETMSTLAANVGFNVPKTWVFDVANIDYSLLDFPCIIKPLLSKEGSKQDIKVCYNVHDLVEHLPQCHCDKLQIQKFIIKDFEFQFIGCSINAGEDIIIPGVAEIIRPSDVSNTGFLKYRSFDNFSYDLSQCISFIKATHYSGLFSLEFLRDKNGVDYFMEINFRNDGNAICVTAGGVNLPYIWCLNKADVGYEDELVHSFRDIYVMPEFDDFFLIIKKRLNIFLWLKDVFKTSCFMEFSKNDMKPFFRRINDVINMIFKKLYMKIVKKLIQNTFSNYWNLGFSVLTNDTLNSFEFNRVKWVKNNYMDRWFADPFILRITESEIIVLVEEFYFPIDRGRISKLTIDKVTFLINRIDVVLELETHLSFPAILRHDGSIYLYPENSASGKLNLYKYDESLNKIEYIKCLVDKPLTDAVMIDINDKHYILGTRLPNPNGHILEVYCSDSKLGDYKYVRSIDFKENTSRNAGCLICTRGKLIKVSQDCNDYYGKGLIFYDMSENFTINEVKRIYSKNKKIIGIHTFNLNENLVAVDAKIYTHGVIAPFLRKLKHLFVR